MEQPSPLRNGEGLVLPLLHARLTILGYKGIPSDVMEEEIEKLERMGKKDGRWLVDHQEILCQLIESHLWSGNRERAELWCYIRNELKDILETDEL